MGTTASVVICTYTEDRWDHLVRSVRSATAQTASPSDVVIVVDHNESLYERALAEFPDVVVVENAGARGLSDARNTGVACVATDVVAFLDDDAVADPGWLHHLIEPYEDPAVVAVGGRAVPVWEAGRPAWFPPEFDWVVGCTYEGHRTTPGPVRNVIGCAMSLRRDVIETSGGFRSELGRIGKHPVGGEETELSIRAVRTVPGGTVQYRPEAIVHHSVPAQRGTWAYFRDRCIAEGGSKALITSMVGTEDALSSERSYALRTLPRGVVRGVADGLAGRKGGFMRALAIVAGLVMTAWGYSRGRFAAVPTGGFEPIRVIDADLDDLAGLPGGASMLLVRRGGIPVGSVTIDAPPDGLAADAVIDAVHEVLGDPRPGPRPSADPRLSTTVVIATRDRPEQLDRCLRSLLANDNVAFDVLIVDNAPSDDATAQMLADRYPGHPAIRYVLEPTPGLATAHNSGLRSVTADIVAFTDDDVVVDQSWLARLTAPFCDPAVGCVTGLIVPLELETRGQWWLESYAGFSKGFESRAFDLGANHPGDVLFPYAAGQMGSGANMAFRTSVLRSLGGFDEALGAGSAAYGGDDLAAFFDVVEAGHRLVYEPAALVRHEHRRDEASLDRQVFGYGAGFGAYAMRLLVERPSRIVDIARRIPGGAHHVLAPSSDRNRRQAADFPARLRRRELAGMLVGPFAYLRSRHQRRQKKASR